MTRGDQLIERAAGKLDAFARRSAGATGIKGKLSGPLADDAELLRGMRPSHIAARLRGRAGGEVTRASAVTEPLSPVPPEPPRKKQPRSGPPAIALAAGAFALGIVIAKVIDWRGHAHPR
jgi:hypothetical protein